jgi:hypothetical protein
MMASSASSNEQQQQQQAVPTRNKKQNQPVATLIGPRVSWPSKPRTFPSLPLHRPSRRTTQQLWPANLPHMTKLVYGVDDLAALEHVRAVWNELIQSTVEQEHPLDTIEQDKATALHSYWWVEQPENTPTAFGTWPATRTSKLSKVVKTINLSFF